jgi:signal transduction histidine kinase
LPWIAPGGAALARLAGLPGPAVWPAVRHDPGAVLLLLGAGPPAPALPFPDALLHQPGPLDFALRQLHRPAAGLFDWTALPCRQVLDACLTVARLACALSLRSSLCDPETAWCAGLLAPLGWLGVCAAAPDAAAACLADPDFRKQPLRAQMRHWGTDQSALARRLASAWGLPGFLVGIVGRLDLPAAHAGRFGAPPGLFAAVRIAVALARELGCDLGLGGTVSADEEACAGLRLADLRPDELLGDSPEPVPAWDDPYRQGLLPALLAVGLDSRRLRQAPLVARLQGEVDELHDALREQTHSESARLQEGKLSALAELAAGAGHEINNPLAVISGQAQYLLGHGHDLLAADTDGVARKALGAIIGQTKRIHGILRDLMQFARPAAPRPAWLDLPTLLGEVTAALESLAAAKGVRVEVSAKPERLAVWADPDQLRTAVGCLLRNAIEAAPAGGWARLVLEADEGETVEVRVEDSGPGPAEEQRPHLFDPFYSGRTAGRGRGLGLPIAWRLMRQQGGDIHLEAARPGVPTRFVLTLPRGAEPPTAERQAA